MKIRYRAGYKYLLVETYLLEISIQPRADIVTEFIKLNRDGMLAIMSGYAWDGPSGPAIDTKNFMRGSLVHDALYQLMSEKRLNPEEYRVAADKELKKICRQDGMTWLRAAWVYAGVRIGGGGSARSRSKITEAP
mgnify:CR=1 FL=1